MWSTKEKKKILKLTVLWEELAQDCQFTVSGEQLGQNLGVKDSQANL